MVCTTINVLSNAVSDIYIYTFSVETPTMDGTAHVVETGVATPITIVLRNRGDKEGTTDVRVMTKRNGVVVGSDILTSDVVPMRVGTVDGEQKMVVNWSDSVVGDYTVCIDIPTTSV